MIAIQDLQFVEQSNSQVEGGVLVPFDAVTNFGFSSGLTFNVDTINGSSQSAYQGTLVSSVFLDTVAGGFAFPSFNNAGFTSSNTVSFS